jgi:SAM-dependent methyltransferase
MRRSRPEAGSVPPRSRRSARNDSNYAVHGVAHQLPTGNLVAFVLDALPPPPARVLEVGCGAGDLAREVDAAGYSVLAIDPQAPEGPIFLRTTVEELDDAGPFNAAVARYSLHHIEKLDRALDRIVSVLVPRGELVIEEFGWDRFDHATAEWYGEQQGELSVESVLDGWRTEHEGLHGYSEMRRALDERFAELLFEWRPYLYRCLERNELESDERTAIASDEIRAIGFRYVGVRRTDRGSKEGVEGKVE